MGGVDWEAQLGEAARTDDVGLARRCFAYVDPHSIAAAEAVLAAAERGSLEVLRLCLLEGANPDGYDYEEGPGQVVRAHAKEVQHAIEMGCGGWGRYVHSAPRSPRCRSDFVRTGPTSCSAARSGSANSGSARAQASGAEVFLPEPIKTPRGVVEMLDSTVPLMVATKAALRVLLAAGAFPGRAKQWTRADISLARSHGAASLAAHWDEPRFLLQFFRGSGASSDITLPAGGERTKRILADRNAPWRPAVHYTRAADFRRVVVVAVWCLREKRCPNEVIVEVLRALDAIW